MHCLWVSQITKNMIVYRTNALSVSHREHDFRLTSGRVAKLTKSIYLCLLIVSVDLLIYEKIATLLYQKCF